MEILTYPGKEVNKTFTKIVLDLPQGESFIDLASGEFSTWAVTSRGQLWKLLQKPELVPLPEDM